MANFIWLLAAWLFAFISPSAFGQDAKLIGAAKKEGGKVLAYGSLETVTAEAIKKAPRPNAGKAFIDFFLHDEAMDIMAKLGEFVNRKGIYPPLPDADKIQFVQMYSFGKKEYEEKKKEYQKIFQ